MKHFVSRVVVLAFFGLAGLSPAAAATSPGGAPAPAVIARIHSVGVKEWNSSDGGRAFKEIWALPASGQLRRHLYDKLAVYLGQTFQPSSGGGDAGAAIRPLLDDLSENEWIFEARELRADLLESTLALRLDDSRRQAWQSAWNQVLSKAKLRADRRTEHLSFFVTNGWVSVHALTGAGASGASEAAGSLWSKLRQGAALSAGARDYWIDFDLDLARAATWTGRTFARDWPNVQLTLTPRKEYVRTVGRLTFRQPLPSPLPKWEIPLGMIRDPLISFTAVRGIEGWLKDQPRLKELGLALPDQLYLWGSSQTAFQIQGAVPVTEASQWLSRIQEKWLPDFNATLKKYAVGSVQPLPDRAELIWKGLPLLVPYVEKARENNRDYLHGGIFPVNPPAEAPPPQLFEQLTSQGNLVYYDWEITQARLNQLRALHQLTGVFLDFSVMSTNSSSHRWLDAIEPRLGNTITEVSLVSPKELQVQRTSHLGLNGLELLGLASWLEGTNFPAFNLNIGFRPVVRSAK